MPKGVKRQKWAFKRISETTAKSNVKRALKTENLSFIQMDKPEIKIAEQPKTAVPEKSKAVEPPKPVIEKKSKPLFCEFTESDKRTIPEQSRNADILNTSIYAAVMPENSRCMRSI